MSLSVYVLTLLLLVAMVIFFATSMLLGQVVKKLTEEPNSLPGFNLNSTSAYQVMNVIFGLVSVSLVFLLAIASFLGSSKGSNGVNLPGLSLNLVTLFIGGIVAAFFAALFIGNSVFLAKILGQD